MNYASDSDMSATLGVHKEQHEVVGNWYTSLTCHHAN